jgi:hypothetical protein
METPNVRSAYAAVVTTLRDLGAVLRPAVAAQYEAPPGGVGASGGVANPTADIVADPRRLALSAEVQRATRSMLSTASLLSENTQTLRTALARWEGEMGTECPRA